MRKFLFFLSFILSYCSYGQPNTLGPTNITYLSTDCNSFYSTYNDPNTTCDGEINVASGGVAMLCDLPALYTYNFSSARDITQFWLETSVGGAVDNGVNSFEVKYYDDLNAGGTLILTQNGFATLINGWQSFNTVSTVLGARSFTFQAISQNGGGSTHAEFDEVGVTSSVSLPIELTEFTVKQVGQDQIQLNWLTASEINNDYFSLEKSKDGETWVDFAIVNGQGDSDISTSYRFIDENIFSGTSYYRLKQVDFDQTYSYSSIETIKVEPVREIKIFPNPAVSNVTIQGLELDGKYNGIELIDILGRNVTLEVSFSNIGDDNIRIELNNLPKGIYLLKIGDVISKFYKE